MNSIVVILILISCVMHAGWNLVCKSKTPSAAFFVLSTSSSIALMTPLYFYFLPRLGQVPMAVWGLLVVTGFFQTFYYVSLGNAYRLNDISLSYPIVRSLPVLLVPLICYLIGYGGTISPVSLGGMVVVVLGCMILPLTNLKSASVGQYLSSPFIFILLAAAGVTAYTIIDSKALELLREGEKPFSLIQSALFFIAFENLAILGFLGLYILFKPHEASHLRTLRKESLRYPLMAGPASTSAYTLVLLAMQFATNVSYVVALRQISILIGVVLGVMILKEKLTRLKMTSTVLIFVGLVIVALG